jgi:hypothetical protein
VGFVHHYCGAHGTRVIAASTHSSDGHSDISKQLLLALIIVMGSMTSEDHCYCGVRDTCDSRMSPDLLKGTG